MLSVSARTFGAIALALIVCALPVPAHADLAQLGDALANVVTFGAWGDSRHEHEAEIERLKAQFAEQLQREKNIGEASVHTARIEEKARSALFVQFTGQQLLKIIATIDVLQGELKEIVVERARAKAATGDFNAWFDSFVTGQNDQLHAIVALIREVSPNDNAAIDKAIEATLLASAKTQTDAATAMQRVRNAMDGAKMDTVERSMQTLEDVRRQLKTVLQSQRAQLRQLIIEMTAEDAARRELCRPPPIFGVECNAATKQCSYYSPDPNTPLPCNGITYLNAFPVSAIRDIIDNIDAYAPNAEFFVDLKLLGGSRPISETAFRSPREIYGDLLEPEKLVPAPFIRTQARCEDIDRYATRLREAIDYIAIFKDASDRPAATRANVAHALSLTPVVTFWLQDLTEVAPKTGGCSGLSAALRLSAPRS